MGSLGRMKRHMKFCFSILIFLIYTVTFSGCALLPKETDTEPIEIVTVEDAHYNTVEVKRGTVNATKTFEGTLISAVQQRMSFPGGKDGRLKAVYVKMGQQVKPGDVVAELECTELNNRIKRQDILVKKAQLIYDEKKASGASQYDLQAANIDIENEISKLNKLKGELGETKIVSRILGRVVSLENLKVGDYVGPYTTIMRIADFTNLRIDCKSSNGYLPFMDEGRTAIYVFEGKEYTAKFVMESSGSEHVYYAIPEKLPANIKPGDKVQVRVSAGQYQNTIYLPVNAVYNNGSNVFYVKLLENGNVVKKNIYVFAGTDEYVMISGNVKEGDKVVISN